MNETGLKKICLKNFKSYSKIIEFWESFNLCTKSRREKIIRETKYSPHISASLHLTSIILEAGNIVL